MTTVEGKSLEGEVKKLAITIRLLSELLDLRTGNLFFYGPSRHLVFKGEHGTIVAKSYGSVDRYQAELRNLDIFFRIIQARSELFREVTGSDAAYIGIPKIDPTLDMSRLPIEVQNGTRISIFAAVPGQLLYDRILGRMSKFEDYLLAAMQIARIQQEGKIYRDKFNLKDVVRDREAGSEDTTYFLNRFKDVFLRQLITYGGVHIPETVQEEMLLDWKILVAENLVRAHRDGYTGYYFDGNPRNHILSFDGSSIVSFDFEDRVYAPALLGLASLLSFGLCPHLSQEEQKKILDRFLLEIEFVNALKTGARDKASRIAEYIKLREQCCNSDLSEKNSSNFYRFLGDDDEGIGKEFRDGFIRTWPYALLDRNSAWLGHKARFRALAERLIGNEEVRFVMEDPVKQYAIEQRQHLEQILQTLEQQSQAVHIKNGRYAQDAAYRLRNRFQELAAHSYFSQN